MLRNFNPRPFEDLHTERFYTACVYKDEMTESGDIVRRAEFVKRSTKKPFTPQSGPDVNIGNLNFMLRSNMNIQHQPQFLKAALAGNPFEATRFERELVRRGNQVADNVEKIKSNSKK